MSFNQIKGQDTAINKLREFILRHRIHQSYLFFGPEGVGKFFTARIFAKALNCLKLKGDPCDECISCLKIEKNQHPDVQLIDYGDSEIPIDSIRQLKRQAGLRPYEGRTKVFVIRNAHRLNPDSASALLKTLEEPPANTVIILVTERPSLLFKTIVSRCQLVRFRPFTVAQLEKTLKDDYGLQGWKAYFLARFSEGKLGLALRLNDEDFALEKNEIIDAFGFPKRRFSNQNKKIERDKLRMIFSVLTSWFRDLYMVKSGSLSSVINIDRQDDILRLQKDFSFRDLDKIINFISEGCLYLEQNINPKIILLNLNNLICKF